MLEIALFGEDYAHQQVIGALVARIATELRIEVELDWRSARGGYGKVAQESRVYLRDLRSQGGRRPDLVVIATDANCKGLNARINELSELDPPAPLILAVPDPHVERWLLLDGAAFRRVFGKGCDAPDQKCSRDRYKLRLREAISATGIDAAFGGIEYADEIVREMDLDRAARADPSFKRFIETLRAEMRARS